MEAQSKLTEIRALLSNKAWIYLTKFLEVKTKQTTEVALNMLPSNIELAFLREQAFGEIRARSWLKDALEDELKTVKDELDPERAKQINERNAINDTDPGSSPVDSAESV